MSGAQVDPHDKMRARDLSKVARGEQAPRPPHEFGTVSPPPPPSSTNNTHDIKNNNNKGENARTAENGSESPSNNYQTRHCYVKYVEYQRCIQQKGEKANECEKIGTHLRSMCPTKWISEWDQEREEGRFPEKI
ncbi:putative cytochrome-c oxidase [Medicago truncatula]|uniref:Cytochrome C oxidase, subunit VIb family protein n=1 Tax=Medicago truncatula TaxID=3880 RepID=A0A072UCZ3_MEDTR|nr:cytochrome c oxidase subunit 6b-3-like [Medicago truncatula]KEH27487.1 cytochrome C oxidase, subunit VIb family protein [Medicago truncatula]RHN53831.1 putative cytochrome-c oxidase [Medicago truncatula]